MNFVKVMGREGASHLPMSPIDRRIQAVARWLSPVDGPGFGDGDGSGARIDRQGQRPGVNGAAPLPSLTVARETLPAGLDGPGPSRVG
jgi:hypothetical protein